MSDVTPKTSKRRVALGVLLGTTMLAGAFAAQGWSATALDPNSATSLPLAQATVANPAGFSELVKRVKPAVVNIATTEKVAERRGPQQMPNFPPGSPMGEMFKHFFDQQQDSESRGPRHALGSGFIIDPAGYVVTNNHVVEGASKIEITLEDGTTHPATVKGRDPRTDLALLKIEAGHPLPFVQFGDSAQANVGDWVIAVGNPFGLGGTVTAGILSAHGRDLNSGPYDDFLQIDAPINPGNSGGPLFDQSGHVIGIDAAIYSPNGGSVGIGFAIPSTLAAKVIAQLKEHGTVDRGWLGVQTQAVTPTMAKAIGRPNTEGALVDEVQANSPAAKVGLKQGDLLLDFNGTPLKTPKDIALAVAGTPKGTSAPLTFLRDGKQQTVMVTIGALPDKQTAAADEDQATDGRVSVGLALAPLTPEVRDELGIEGEVKGAVIAQVKPDSPAAESGLKRGDVIVRVGSDGIAGPKDVVAKIHAAQDAKKEAVPLLVMRQGTTYYLALQLAKA